MKKHPFAPGTIETHHRTRLADWLGTPSQRRELWLWLELMFWVLFIVGWVSLLAGFIAGQHP